MIGRLEIMKNETIGVLWRQNTFQFSVGSTPVGLIQVIARTIVRTVIFKDLAKLNVDPTIEYNRITGSGKSCTQFAADRWNAGLFSSRPNAAEKLQLLSVPILI